MPLRRAPESRGQSTCRNVDHISTPPGRSSRSRTSSSSRRSRNLSPSRRSHARRSNGPLNPTPPRHAPPLVSLVCRTGPDEPVAGAADMHVPSRVGGTCGNQRLVRLGPPAFRRTCTRAQGPPLRPPPRPGPPASAHLPSWTSEPAAASALKAGLRTAAPHRVRRVLGRPSRPGSSARGRREPGCEGHLGTRKSTGLHPGPAIAR